MSNDNKAYFDRVASDWDEMRKSFYSTSVRNKALRIAQVHPGCLASDLGAGTGFVTESLLDCGLHVIAIDESHAMLNQLVRKFDGNDLLKVRVGEAESLPIANNSLDYAFANMYMHHVERPWRGIQEAFRTLKSGGVLVITDLDEHNYDFLRQEHNDRWLGFNRDSIRRWYFEAGFKDVELDCVGESCTSQSQGSCDFADIGIFYAYGRK